MGVSVGLPFRSGLLVATHMGLGAIGGPGVVIRITTLMVRNLRWTLFNPTPSGLAKWPAVGGFMTIDPLTLQSPAANKSPPLHVSSS